MKIEAGQSLLHYRLSEKIGEGGMGQVWGALDTTLDRRVAIKILPDAFAHDADRLARFEREAKLLASLNHPNIAVLHGLHQTPGNRTGQAGVHFLSMEWVEGVDLAERLRRGSLPVDEALQIGLQLARALEAAHERGIIHRDLKPANIMVGPDGTIKVLDFGLAKSIGPESSAPDVDPARSPTLTMASTQAGVILGTAGYMAPEQVRGKPADRRADIWAFGVLLFEVFTGIKTFRGDTVSDSLARILEREPDWDALPRTVPAGIRRLLRRCLSKNVSRRLQAIGDARIVIEECIEDPSAPLDQSPSSAPPTWRRLLPYALVPVALLAGWILRRTEAPKPAPTSRVEVPLPEGLRLTHGHRNGLALSPDGRILAFTAGTMADPFGNSDDVRIYLRNLDEWSPRMLADVDGQMPRFSPSGRWLAFGSDDGLFRVPIDGGEVRLVHKSAPWGGMTWATDDFIVFAPEMEGGLVGVPAAGGDPVPITTLDDDAFEVSHRLPHALPGGKTVLFTAIHYRAVPISGGDPKIFAVDLTTGERKRLIDDAFDARYVTTGHLVFVREARLFAVPFDLERTEVTGPEVLVLDGVTHSIHTIHGFFDSGAAQFSVSDSGILAYASGSVHPDFKRRLLWVDRKGNAETIEDVPEGDWYSARVSPDGRKLLLTSRYPPRDVWIYDRQRKTMRRQTFESDQYYAVWGPGPDRFTTDSDREGPAGIYTKLIDSGPGEIEKLKTPTGSMLLPGSWSRDGNRFVFFLGNAIASARNLVLSVDGGVAQFPSSDFIAMSPQFSPDGQWIAYVIVDIDSESSEVFISRYPEVGPAIQISNQGGDSPTWSNDGSELFYRSAGKMFAVRIEPGSVDPRPSEPVKLMDFPYWGCGPVRCYDIAPDGRFLAIEDVDEGPNAAIEAFYPDRIRVVQNWLTELAAKAPVAR